MNDLLFQKKHAFVMQYLTNNVAVALICLTTCLSGHLEWWECLNMYKMHSISHMEPKVQLFFWHLEPDNAWFDNEAIIHMQRFNLCVRKWCIHNSLNYQNRQNTFWDIWKNARGGDLLFWLSVYRYIYIFIYHSNYITGNKILKDRHSATGDF